MKKVLSIIASLALALMASSALAITNPAAYFELPTDGPLTCTLPETAETGTDGHYTSYVVSWEPLADAYQFYAGVVMAVESIEGVTYQKVVDGYVHSGTIKDGQGTEHSIKQAFFDSILLEGTATSVDVAPILRLFELERGDIFDGYYMLITTVPDAGQPVTQLVPLPIEPASGR